jgi:GAF domain-containing protein
VTIDIAPPADDPAVPDLASAYGELQNLLIDTPDVNNFLRDLAGLAVALIAPIDSCGITLRRDGQPMTVAASGDLASLVDELQYGRGVGPCLEALHTGHIVVVSDLATDERWGDYRLHAIANGVSGSLSIPLTAGSAPVGALNLYTTQPHDFTAAEIGQATAFAAQASGALTLVMRQANQAVLEGQLREALSSRAIIDQALGILMGQRQCSAADAFAILREQSQHRNVKLQTVAAELIQTVTGAPAQPPRPFTQRP